MNRILYAVPETYKELLYCWNNIKINKGKKERAQYITLFFYNLIFFFSVLVLTGYSLYLIFAGIFVNPIGFLGLILTIPFLFIYGTVRKNVYPKIKHKLLNGLPRKKH